MHGPADRQNVLRIQRRRVVAVACAVAVALAAAGCSDSSGGSGAGSSSASTAPVVTGEQVVTTCFQEYFYNGVLPKAAAQQNCTACVVAELRHLGVRPAPGESVIDMLTGDRLSNSDVQRLQGVCNETDTNAQ